MKDSEPVRSILHNAERFQTDFSVEQSKIEEKLSAAESVPKEKLQDHFNGITESIQSLQNLYSSASPYIRIYDRKKCQDSLQTLQNKLQDVETRLIPRKKFAFKTKRVKIDPPPEPFFSADIPCLKTRRATDVADGPDGSEFCDRTDEVLIVPSTAVSGRAVSLARLRNCTVQVLGSASTIHITDVVGCSISCGPVATSVFVEEAHTCIMQLACQQLRIHQTSDTEFRIHVTSKAIIEDSNGLRFGVYSFRYPTLDDDYSQSTLRKEINNWCDVDDFNWLVAGQHSPNWSIINGDDS